jgi:DNA-binding transcriptional regulator YbjK
MTDDLIAEQLTHAIDLMKAEITATRSDLSHYQDLANQRLDQLETCKKDHEDRLRQVQDTPLSSKSSPAWPPVAACSPSSACSRPCLAHEAGLQFLASNSHLSS